MSAEIDKPNNLLITGVVLGVIGLSLGLLIIVARYFDVEVSHEISEKVLTHVNPQLTSVRADEQARLTHYQWVDQKAGVVRIPLDRAVELTLKEWPDRPSGPAVPSEANAPAPAPALAPAPGAAPTPAAPGTPAAAGAK